MKMAIQLAEKYLPYVDELFAKESKTVCVPSAGAFVIVSMLYPHFHFTPEIG